MASSAERPTRTLSERLETLTAELPAVMDQTMQPTRASLWLRPPQRAGSAGSGAAARRAT
jgi:hypothetical protein